MAFQNQIDTLPKLPKYEEIECYDPERSREDFEMYKEMWLTERRKKDARPDSKTFLTLMFWTRNPDKLSKELILLPGKSTEYRVPRELSKEYGQASVTPRWSLLSNSAFILIARSIETPKTIVFRSLSGSYVLKMNEANREVWLDFFTLLTRDLKFRIVMTCQLVVFEAVRSILKGIISDTNLYVRNEKADAYFVIEGYKCADHTFYETEEPIVEIPKTVEMQMDKCNCFLKNEEPCNCQCEYEFEY